MKIAVFSCAGLGDALITLILSHNLSMCQHRVTTFHPFIHQLQAWFPYSSFASFPPDFDEFDQFFIFYEKSPWMEEVLQNCLTHYRDRTTVLNPIATPHHDYPYWENGRFNGMIPFADNLVLFCRNILGIKKASKNNGIVIPEGVIHRRYPRRVVIHPTSSRKGKNWPAVKFFKLARKLSERGFDPIFVVSPAERGDWPTAPLFSNLDATARFIAESSYMIGNCSGIGHLASCLGIPTLSIFRNKRSAHFWRPAFGIGEICFPRGWIPNLKGLRWRDKYWYWEISTRCLIRTFDKFSVFCDNAPPNFFPKKIDVIR